MNQKRIELNKDSEMIKVIKKELMRLNDNGLEESESSADFTWTCHKECLWIACEFH